MKIRYFFAVIAASFHSPYLYRAVAQHWKGYALGYALSVIAISSLLMAIGMAALVMLIPTFHQHDRYSVDEQPHSSAHASSLVMNFIDSIPVITIHQGEVFIKEKQPYIVSLTSAHIPFIIIDTEGSVTSLTGSDAAVLITKKNIIVKAENGGTDTYPVSELFKNDIVISHDYIMQKLEWLRSELLWIIPVVFLPLTLCFLMVWFLVDVVIAAVIAKIAMPFLQLSFPFDALVRLAAVAALPATIIASVMMIFMPYLFGLYRVFFYYIIYGCYVFFALSANRNKKEQ